MFKHVGKVFILVEHWPVHRTRFYLQVRILQNKGPKMMNQTPNQRRTPPLPGGPRDGELHPELPSDGRSEAAHPQGVQAQLRHRVAGRWATSKLRQQLPQPSAQLLGAEPTLENYGHLRAMHLYSYIYSFIYIYIYI